MPTRLQLARVERHWSQPKLAAVMQAQARAQGLQLAGPASLKSLISRWENGKVKPDALHSRLLREVFGLTDVELGFVDEPLRPAVDTAVEQFARDLDAARSVGAEHVTALQAQTDSFRLLDRPLGAPRLLEQIRAHLDGLQALLTRRVLGPQRRPVARVLADTAALAGWQALDVGAAAQSWQHFETGKAAAREAGDPALLAYATGEQAYVLLDVGRSRDAVDLLDEARRESGGRVPPAMRCWLQAARAEALSAVGDEYGALTGFDAAASALTGQPDGATPYLVLSDCHLSRWRGNALARLGHPEALPCLSAALAGMDPAFRRATASLHCDLALAYQRGRNLDAAAEHAALARRIAAEIGSVRQARRVERLRVAA